MKIIILGGAGFIGTNLALELSKNAMDYITVVDEKEEYFNSALNRSNIKRIVCDYTSEKEIEKIINGHDIVYHLISTNNPTSSNINVAHDIADNIKITINILEVCVRANINKLIFVSSGGTVYGKTDYLPISENIPTNPITSYGIQKLTIEKILFLYNYLYGLEYVVVRLSNPYGPYQRPNGKLGAVTTFLYRAINNEKIIVYGDGSVVRDYIYVSDAIEGIVKMSHKKCGERIYNLGSGKGTSINEVVDAIKKVVGIPVNVEYVDKRLVDVPMNILDVTRYNNEFGEMKLKSLEEGIRMTMDYFMLE